MVKLSTFNRFKSPGNTRLKIINPGYVIQKLRNLLRVHQHFTLSFNSCIIANSFTPIPTCPLVYTHAHCFVHGHWPTTMYIPCTHVGFACLYKYVQCSKWFFHSAHDNSISWLIFVFWSFCQWTLLSAVINLERG